MTDQATYAELPASQRTVQTAESGAPSRSWWWIFLLLSLWMFGIRIGCLAFIHSEVYLAAIPPMNMERLANLTPPEFLALMEDTATMEKINQYFGQVERFNEPEYAAMLEQVATRAGILIYLVQIVGIAVIPALLAKWGALGDSRAEAACRTEKRVTVGLLALGVAFMPVFLFARGLLAHRWALYSLLALFTLCPSVALGISLRRGALYWQAGKAALYVGMAYVLDHVLSQVQYYSWIATENAAFHLTYTYAYFALLLVAAGAIRLRLRGEDAPALPPESSHVYPPRFPTHVCVLLAVHALFSSAINTVIYFDNMDDFHTLSYELFFYILAFFVMLASVLLYHHRRWLAPTLIGLLLVCFGQGLSLFGIQNTQLAVAYNLVTMIGKVPPLMFAMIVPVYYAVGMRRPGLACLGFAIPTGADLLLHLTQFTEKGIGGILPGQSRQGVLLFVGLCVIGALFFLHDRFERTRTDALQKDIREGLRERKSTRETVEGLDLTAREKEVVSLLLAGDSQKMIAAKLSVSLSTVSFHTRNLYRKLNIQSKGELFALFMESEPPVIA